MKSTCLTALIAIFLSSYPGLAFSAAKESVLQRNKRIVREFYDMAFNQHKPLEAAKKYLAESYRQHNPYVADGRQGFMDAFAKELAEAKEADHSVTDFKRFIAEDDLVMIHAHKINNPADKKERGVAGIDIFRVKGDLITEHWDVNQKIPENPKNNNTMF